MQTRIISIKKASSHLTLGKSMSTSSSPNHYLLNAIVRSYGSWCIPPPLYSLLEISRRIMVIGFGKCSTWRILNKEDMMQSTCPLSKVVPLPLSDVPLDATCHHDEEAFLHEEARCHDITVLRPPVSSVISLSTNISIDITLSDSLLCSELRLYRWEPTRLRFSLRPIHIWMMERWNSITKAMR